MLFELFKAVAVLGIPLALLSWLIFTRLFLSGELDRGDNRKSIERSIKGIKKSFAKAKKTDSRSFSEKSRADLVFEKWMYFGSGFYGLAALWTFVVIEATELINLVLNFPSFDELFGDGIVSLLFTLAMNQLGNLISAFVWFGFWDGSILICVLVAYAGYWLGIEAARRGLQVSRETLLAQIRRKK